MKNNLNKFIKWKNSIKGIYWTMYLPCHTILVTKEVYPENFLMDRYVLEISHWINGEIFGELSYYLSLRAAKIEISNFLKDLFRDSYVRNL